MFTKQSHHRAVVVQVHQVATDYAGGYREGLCRASALAELAALTTDPDLLSRAAAIHAVADNWYAINAVDLLFEAGAAPGLVERYLNGPHPADEWTGAQPDPAPERRAG